MKFDRLRQLALGAVIALSPLVANAVLITSTTPTWSNVVGGSGVTLNATNGSYTDVRWGTSLGSGQSGLGFDPANPPTADIPVNTLFQLGSLRHYNNPIGSGSAASQVDLALNTLITGAIPASQSFGFRFFIDETPNTAPCAYPSTTPCADRITFSNLDLTSAFIISGVNYTIALAGFSTDGTTISTFFDSQEGGTNTIGLYGRITQAAQVPEPGTLALFCLALLGFGLSRRRGSGAQ